MMRAFRVQKVGSIYAFGGISISTRNGWSIFDFCNWKHCLLLEVELNLYNQSLFQYRKKIHV